MNHQPFEHWILETPALSSQEQRELRRHLEECPQCQQVQQSWLAVRQQFQLAPMVAPAPGFSVRWQANLAKRAARQQRRQVLTIGFIGLLAAASLLVLIALLVVSNSNPGQWVLAGSNMILTAIHWMTFTQEALAHWIRLVPFSINFAIWLSLMSTLSVFCVIWLLAVWQTAIKTGANR